MNYSGNYLLLRESAQGKEGGRGERRKEKKKGTKGAITKEKFMIPVGGGGPQLCNYR